MRCLLLALSGQSDRTRLCPLLDQSGQRWISARDGLSRQAAQNHLPVIYPYRFIAEEGGLISYGIDISDLYRLAASYIDRILRGTKPADLPVQQPSKFELVINLKTAKALDLEVPLSLQIRADALIE